MKLLSGGEGNANFYDDTSVNDKPIENIYNRGNGIPKAPRVDTKNALYLGLDTEHDSWKWKPTADLKEGFMQDGWKWNGTKFVYSKDLGPQDKGMFFRGDEEIRGGRRKRRRTKKARRTKTAKRSKRIKTNRRRR